MKMEIDLMKIEKEEVKRNGKKYLYALGVILVTGLFHGTATHIPVGAQFVTSVLSSVGNFFNTGHGKDYM